MDCISANAIGFRDGTDSGRRALIYSIDFGAQKASCAKLPQSPEATTKPRRTFIDAALALDEITQGFIQILEFRGEPQNARPFAPHPIIDLFWIGRAKDHGGKRFWLPYRFVPLQVSTILSIGFDSRTALLAMTSIRAGVGRHPSGLCVSGSAKPKYANSWPASSISDL